jgi:hypothetical protein
LWLSLKANEAERPRLHPRPRSWLKRNLLLHPSLGSYGCVCCYS